MGSGIIQRFIVNQIGKVIRSGGEVADEELAKARMEICNGCKHKGRVGLKNHSLVTVEGCTICKCPLMTKTRTLMHRDYSNEIYKASKNLKDLIRILDKNNVPFVRTQCDLGKWLGTDIQFLGTNKILELNMATVDSIKDFGVKRANPHACDTNTMRLDACEPCNDLETCEDGITIPGSSGKILSGLTIDGEFKVLVVDADDDVLLQEELNKIVRVVENKVFVTARIEGADTIIRHIGQCRLESVTLSDGTVIDAVKKCNCVKITTWELKSPVGNTPNLTINDSEGNELVNKALTADYTTVSDANATALQAELTACYNDATFTVTANTTLGYYEILIESQLDLEVYLGGKCAVFCKCEERFVA